MALVTVATAAVLADVFKVSVAVVTVVATEKNETLGIKMLPNAAVLIVPLEAAGVLVVVAAIMRPFEVELHQMGPEIAT